MHRPFATKEREAIYVRGSWIDVLYDYLTWPLPYPFCSLPLVLLPFIDFSREILFVEPGPAHDVTRNEQAPGKYPSPSRIGLVQLYLGRNC